MIDFQIDEQTIIWALILYPSCRLISKPLAQRVAYLGQQLSTKILGDG